jgi:arylsulfatase A-like enzyme
MQEMLLNADRVVGSLISAAEERVGANNLVVVFTADHGVSPVPEENVKNKMPGGRLNARAEREAVQQALAERFGPGEYIAAVAEGGIYFKSEVIAAAHLDRTEMEKTAAAVLLAQPHVFRVYTRTNLMSGDVAGDLVDQRVRRGYHARSADVVVIHDPYWLTGTGTNHGSPFSYDTHVPLMMWGAQIRPGRYHAEAAIQDVAPTVATVLGVAAPSGSVGRVLGEALR